MRRTLLVFSLVAATAALVSAVTAQNAPTSQPTSQPTVKLPKKWHDELAKPIAAAASGRGAIYGSTPKMEKTVPLQAVQTNAAIFANHDIQVAGKITGICAKKGCWLRLVDGDQELFVKFKDYSFFVPRHLAGHDVTLEGRVKVTTVTEAERRHYAEDAGKSTEEIAKIVGDEVQLTMMADSVVIEEPKPEFRTKIELEFGSTVRAAARSNAALTPLDGMPIYGQEGQKIRVRAEVSDMDRKNGSWLMLQDGGTRVRVAVEGFGPWMKLIQTGPTEIDAWLEWGQGWTATAGTLRVAVPAPAVLKAMQGTQ